MLRNSKPCAYSQKSKFYFLSVYPPNACNYVAHLCSNSSTSVTFQLRRPFDSLGCFILVGFRSRRVTQSVGGGSGDLSAHFFSGLVSSQLQRPFDSYWEKFCVVDMYGWATVDDFS